MPNSPFRTSTESCLLCTVYRLRRSMSGGNMGFCRPSGAFGISRLRPHGLRRGLFSYAPPGLQRMLIGGLAICVILISLAMPAFAFEPMPPIMQKLLEVFPEENGRFVDEPFGSTAEMPEDAKPLFETFRVVVPGPEDIEKSLARLFSASGHLPIRKITRYDKEPGAPGLAGFRGVWCQTEDKDHVGFSIVTINQNRFLIWAKMGYYPASANDSINSKVRDQYARDVSQYLAGVDSKVPENDAPEASGRGLPEWVGLYRDCYDFRYLDFDELERMAEIRAWGIESVKSFCPTGEMLDRIMSEVPDSLLQYQRNECLQEDMAQFVEGNFDGPSPAALTRAGYKGNERMKFAVDRYGRVRYCKAAGEGEISIRLGVLFPAVPILSAGSFRHLYPGEYFDTLNWISTVTCLESYYFYSYSPNPAVEILLGESDAHLRALGYFIAALKNFGFNLEAMEITKSLRPWEW